MEYLVNTLSYADYVRLRESVGWLNFSKEQTENAINHSLYIATAAENGETVAMGRLIGDGQYHLIADVIVHPDFQHQKIGTSILNMLLQYVSENTPAGGVPAFNSLPSQEKSRSMSPSASKESRMNTAGAA